MLFVKGCKVEPLMLPEGLIRNDLQMTADVRIKARPSVGKQDD